MKTRMLILAAAAAWLLAALQGCGSSAAAPAATLSGPDVRVENTLPANNRTGVAQNTRISITFSEEMDPGSVNTTTFTLTEAGDGPVAGTVHTAGKMLVFEPAQPLKPFTVYSVTATTGLRCVDSGESMQNDYSWTFVTGANMDATPPLVADDAFGVQVKDGVYLPVIVAFFSEPMDPGTVSADSVLVTDPDGNAVSVQVQYIGVSALIYPTVPLAPLSTYTATVTTGVTDLAGNHMKQARSWAVHTPNLATLTGKSTPSVVTTTPADDSTNVLLGTEIIATFSEALDPTSLSASTFQVVRADGMPVTGTLTYTGLTATFVPDYPLAPNASYMVTVTTGATSLDGVPFDHDYEWMFTTGSDITGTPPVVDFAVPLLQDTNVALNAAIVADFDEPMDPVTINTGTFTLTDEMGEPVPGMVTYTGTTAVFTPDLVLLPGTTYTARITTGATDANGEAMANDYVWTFTTGDTNAGDTPQVLFTDPAVNDADISPYKKISVAFNEVMDPATLNTGTITVVDADGNPVTGTVSYMAYAAVFTPSAPLAPGETYTVTVSGSVKDLEGIPMGADYSFVFFTAVPM